MDFTENKIKDENEITENVDNAVLEPEDPEEALAVSEMVRNIAEGDKVKKAARKVKRVENPDDDDEEEWDLSGKGLIKDLITKVRSSQKTKTKKTVEENTKEDKSSDEELITFVEPDIKDKVSEETFIPEPFSIEEDLKEELKEENVLEPAGFIEDEVKTEASVSEASEPEEAEAEQETGVEEETEQVPVISEEELEALRKEKAREAELKAEEEERKKNEIKEMRMAVEDIMFRGETKAEREARHQRAAEMEELPVIDLSEINFFSDDSAMAQESSETAIDDISEHLAMVMNDEFKIKKKKWPKIVGAVAGCVALFALFILFTRPGHAIVSKVAMRFFFSKIETVDPENNPDQPGNISGKLPDNLSEFIPAVTPTPTQAVVDPDATDTPVPTPTMDPHPHFAEDDSVVNILLIGADSYEGVSRSDSMMIASLDKDGGPLKLVTLMRDMYVEIPPNQYYEDYTLNRLNAAYAFGGAPLLMEAVEFNFGIKCDGYVTVDYEGFESIIDTLGGIEISLTAEEAKYLNTTNYISDKTQRNVVTGSQYMTGNQVVGYCRIRKVPTANGLYMDFGRTYRQRVVLGKLFDRFKTSSITQLYGLMNKCLKYVKCPKNLEGLAAECIQIVLEKKMFTLDTYRVPFSGHYAEERVVHHYDADGNPVEWEVVTIDDQNATMLHDILYGKEETEE